MNKKLKVAILISGRGSNMQALVAACENEDFPAEVVVVASNKKDAAGLEFARSKKIPTVFVDHKSFSSREDFDKKMSEEIAKFDVDVVCLAGFMRILSPWFVDKWMQKIINIHPSLLPSFKGANAIEDALKFGVKITGCTTHLVNHEVDGGKILMQEAVEIEDNDNKITLANKIHQKEHIIYPKTLKLFCHSIIGNLDNTETNQ